MTILLALIGLVVKYFNDLAMARRKDRLDRVNLQLRLLYGPLFALTDATDAAWKQFRKQYRPGMPFFSKSRKPTDSELEAWRLWMVNVFMPMNRRMVEFIVSNADLLDGEMPRSFLGLVAHVTSYEVILARWASNDFEVHVPEISFPEEIQTVIRNNYNVLRDRQRALLAITRVGIK